MAPNNTAGLAVSNPKCPSERTIAFAISIVRSKPEELSVREYIRLLRQHIARGRRENAISSVHRHLDRSSYWRSEYERAKMALSVSDAEAVDLKREIEALKGKLESAKAAAGGAKKRKKIDEDVIPVPRSPKRAKRNASPDRQTVGDGDMLAELDFSSFGEVGNILMRSLFQIHFMMKHPQSIEPLELAHHLVRAASALPQVVQQAVQQTLQRMITGHQLLKSTFVAASRAAAALIVGVNKLACASDGSDKPVIQGQVIYAYVHMFANLLVPLSDVSAAHAQAEATVSTYTRPATSKGRGKAQQPKIPNIKDDPTLNLITSFLCGLIDHLDPKLETHNALFEGIAWTILNQLGSRLYTTVFDCPRGTTITDEILASVQPDEIEDAVTLPRLTERELEIRQTKLEAPYLIHLFTRLMSAAPAHLGAVMSARTGKPKQAHKGSMKGALATTAKNRLQRTLVNCIFGTEGVDVDDPFTECLKMPGLPAKALPMPKIKEAEVKEWFKEEAWRSLGWEILGKEGGW